MAIALLATKKFLEKLLNENKLNMLWAFEKLIESKEFINTYRFLLPQAIDTDTFFNLLMGGIDTLAKGEKDVSSEIVTLVSYR